MAFVLSFFIFFPYCQLSHPYNKVRDINVLRILILVFLDFSVC